MELLVRGLQLDLAVADWIGALRMDLVYNDFLAWKRERVVVEVEFISALSSVLECVLCHVSCEGYWELRSLEFLTGTQRCRRTSLLPSPAHMQNSLPPLFSSLSSLSTTIINSNHRIDRHHHHHNHHIITSPHSTARLPHLRLRALYKSCKTSPLS